MHSSALTTASVSVAPAPAARTNVQGRVTDAETGQPVIGTQVFIEELSLGAVTGTDGRYVLMGVPDGAHELTLEHRCYDTVRVEIEVATGSAVPPRVDVGLPLSSSPTSRGYSEPLGGCRRSASLQVPRNGRSINP